jgi:hypothetical protein
VSRTVRVASEAAASLMFMISVSVEFGPGFTLVWSPQQRSNRNAASLSVTSLLRTLRILGAAPSTIQNATPNVASGASVFASVFDPDIGRHRQSGKAAAAPGP